MDLVTGRPPDEELPTVATEYAIALQRRLNEVHHSVRDQLKFAGESMRRHYDRNSKAAEFQVGDLVWLYNPRRKKGLSPKLQSPWEGPYTIVERVTEVTFRIRRGRQRFKIVHADRLWEYQGDPHYTWDQTGAEAENELPLEGDDVEAAELGETVVWPEEPEMLLDMRDEGPETTIEDDVAVQASTSFHRAEAEVLPSRPRRRRTMPQYLQDYVIDI